MDAFKRRMCFGAELIFQLGPHCEPSPAKPPALPADLRGIPEDTQSKQKSLPSQSPGSGG